MLLRLPFGLSVSVGRSSPVRKGSVGPTQIPWLVREPYAGAWQEGAAPMELGPVTTFGAVYGCVSRIAYDIAKLPPRLKVLEAETDVWEDAPPASPHWIPLRKPNGYQNRIQFLIAWIASKLLHGNVYVLKVRDARAMVAALHVLDPRRVTPMVTRTGEVYYSLGGDDLAQAAPGAVVPASEIIHDRAITLAHPLIGVSPIYACGFSASQGLRIQKNSSRFFSNMSRPSGMLTAPGVIDDVTAARLKREWEENYSAENLGRLAVLGDGLKYEAMTIPADDAQLIQQLDWTVTDVARCFGVPLYKIGAGPIPTAGNVEALEMQYYSGCLQILIESVELALEEGLALPSGYTVELDLDGLLRMDSATKVDVLAKAIGGAILAPNEGRSRLNLPPIEGGDSVYLQQQNYSLAALARRDAREDPFSATPSAAPVAAPPPSAPEVLEEPEPTDADEELMAARDVLVRAAVITAFSEAEPLSFA